MVASEAPPASFGDLTSGRVGLGGFISENLAASLPYMAGTIGGGLAGFARGGARGAIVGAVAGGTPQFSASNVSRAVEEQGSLTDAAALRSLVVAPLQSGADAAVGRFLPGAGKLLGGFAATQSGGFLRRTATSMVKAAGTEAVTEAAQQVGERYAAGLTLNDADAAGEYINAAATAFVLGGVLGAGGGFRRTDAVAKPPDTVTEEDISAHVDGILDGSLKALPPPPPRALPAPPDVIGRPDGQSEVNPSGRIQLALPAPEGPGPDFIVDSEGRVAPPGFEGERAIALDRSQPPPAQPPAVEPDLSGALPPAPPTPLTASTTLGRGLGAVEGFDPLAPQGQNSQPAAPTDPILSRVQAAQEADTQQFADFLAEQKKGLRGGFVQQVQATNELDLLGKVYDQVFVEQDTRANTAKFAQRLGLVDENLQPTELAQYVAATREAQSANQPANQPAEAAAQTVTRPAANRGSAAQAQPAETPARIEPQVTNDPTFEAQWKQLQRDAGVARVRGGKGVLDNTPANLDQARAQIFQALANDTSSVEVSQVEKVARKMGLITDDDSMDITPLGRKTYLTTPEGLEETVLAAQQQGYTGAQASIFDRAVRDQVSGATETPAFSNFNDLAAYQAGKVWADSFIQNAQTRTAAQTQAIQNRILARNPKAAGRVSEGEFRRAEASRKVNPAAIQRKALNDLINNADLTGVPDQEQTQLRRMVADGATPEQVGQAIQKLQGGGTIRTVPPRPQPRPIAGGRGQPIFKEMNNPRGPARSQQRTETEAAVRAYDLRNLLRLAESEGAITKARATKLHTLLDRGEVDQVQRLMKDFDPDAKPRGRAAKVDAEFSSGIGTNDPAFEQAVTGKSFIEVATYMAQNAPSPFYRELMTKIRTLGQSLESAGAELSFRVITPNDLDVPRQVDEPGTKALTYIKFNPKNSAAVYIKNSEHGNDAAVNYQVVAHEMLHSVTMLQTTLGRDPAVYGKTTLGKAVADLDNVLREVQAHLQARQSSGAVLTDFERRVLDRENNALDDIDELLAWTLTNPEMQRYLNGVEYAPRQSVFSRLVAAIRTVLGMEPRYDSALMEVLRVAENIFGAPREELRSILPRNEPEADLPRERAAAISAGSDGARNRTAQASNETTQRVAAAANSFVDNLNLRDKGAKARRTMLGWLSHNQIDRQYGEQIPAALEHSDAHRERVAIRSRFEQMGEDAYQRFEKLEQGNPKAAERVGQLMASTTEFQIDPDKTWEEHTWHQNDPNAANLKRLHGEAVKLANDLKRGDGAGWAAYQNFRMLNEAQNFARMAVGLHGLVATDPELAMGIQGSWSNPADQFMRAENINSAAAIRDHWAKALDDQVAAATEFVREKKGEAARGSESDQRAMRQHLSPVEMQINAIYEAKAGMAKAPYFHLGRFGDNFGSAVIRKGADGNVDPAAQRKVAEALEAAGFTDAQISTDSTKPRFMLRFDTVDQAVRFRQVALELQQQGVLGDEEIKVGPRNRTDNYGTADGLPQFVASYISNIEASPMFAVDEGMSPTDRAALEKLKLDTIQLARDTWIESQPDSSISKVLSKRYTVPGYNKDMIRNFAHRWRVGSINIANVASAPKFNRAFTNMRAQYNDALVANRKGPNGEALAPGDPFVVQDVMTELKVRDAKTPLDETADTFDKLRGFAHSYFLGFSPAYGMINMTQLGVTALPELAKKHGYGKSFHAMRRASTQALAIIKAVSSEAGNLGWRRWGDVAITDTVLKKAGLDQQTRDFMQHMLATGTIDIGSMARSLGQVADNEGVGGNVETYLRLSSAIGLYTETFSRLTTALAARELHGGFGAEAQTYAAKTVSESMFDYQNWNTARQLGKKGFLGPVTPLLTQFMSYQVQVTEKLYSEALAAFQRPRPGESEAQAKQRRAESRRFLGAHLAAVTALAGTLGLPFVTVFATVIERMVDLLGDDEEPFDATAAYRNFLTSVFGKGVGEVLARGAPRAVGFDISARAGEQNLLPFSEFLADRRSWKEAVAATAGRSLGAVPSMLQNVMDGGSQLADGDFLGGAKTMLPIAFKSPIEAYRMTSEGYIDTKGNKLPMSPEAQSVVWQLLGFSPDEKAEYGEARGDQSSRRGEIVRRAGKLRQGIVRALRSGDTDSARDLIQEAIQFDQDNPAFAVIPSISSTFSRQEQEAARARATTTPTGVARQDIAGQELTGYANF